MSDNWPSIDEEECDWDCVGHWHTPPKWAAAQALRNVANEMEPYTPAQKILYDEADKLWAEGEPIY